MYLPPIPPIHSPYSLPPPPSSIIVQDFRPPLLPLIIPPPCPLPISPSLSPSLSHLPPFLLSPPVLRASARSPTPLFFPHLRKKSPILLPIN